MSTDFSTWVTAELNRRDWSQSELARRGGVTPAAINRVITGDRKPGIDVCRAIAKAFELSEMEVFERAGIAAPNYDRAEIETKQLLADFYSLPDEDRQLILDQMRALRRLREDQARYEARS